jgi:hypothetical protein
MIEVNKSVQGNIGKYRLRYLTLRAMVQFVFNPINCINRLLLLKNSNIGHYSYNIIMHYYNYDRVTHVPKIF